MRIDEKLQVILSRAYPKESNIKLKVDVCPVHFNNKACYGVAIIKNGNELESFYIPIDCVMRMIEVV